MEVAVVEEDMVEVDKAMETAVEDMVVEEEGTVVVAAVAAVVMTAITTAVETLVSSRFECKWNLQSFWNT